MKKRQRGAIFGIRLSFFVALKVGSYYFVCIGMF